ncbi:MAG TPA: NAD-dependent epimerase/dehydratase family protein [Kiritimatiellia bacterium]|nr:NAD-dependent epimerase/dehydratase family protein [Kiritimatiellia bacterium]HNS79856.1 NAD-dependent epimerase/dehydratase family protein [Kiritimatiellia bacterium]HPA77029.1 NAD-dependent epimerase/dehydratase family protein [Kiritimatiellia bacterium]HQQ04113.1 NAD-dependent epimerase/dehydratase family protein [Kiritimatiellia bacterium]
MFKRILITGATGFLGHHVLPVMRKEFDAEIIAVGSRNYDLLKPGEPDRMMQEIKPDCVLHMAAKSGGIIDNKARPADYFYQNLFMNLHTFEAAFRHGAKKFMTFMGGCSYPATATSPIGEDQMWKGLPQIESAGYSVAKLMNLTQSWAYRVQHGFNSVVLIPGNMYGEWDNFNLTQAHVIPSLIRKYLEAEERGDPEIIAYGTGKPTRDFVYAGDVAATVPWFLKNYNSSDPVNISAGKRISIRELAETIKKVTGFRGKIVWDTSKPDGQMDKIFDVARLHSLGLSCDTSLEDGLRRTTEWFIKARKDGTVRL